MAWSWTGFLEGLADMPREERSLRTEKRKKLWEEEEAIRNLEGSAPEDWKDNPRIWAQKMFRQSQAEPFITTAGRAEESLGAYPQQRQSGLSKILAGIAGSSADEAENINRRSTAIELGSRIPAAVAAASDADILSNQLKAASARAGIDQDLPTSTARRTAIENQLGTQTAQAKLDQGIPKIAAEAEYTTARRDINKANLETDKIIYMLPRLKELTESEMQASIAKNKHELASAEESIKQNLPAVLARLATEKANADLASIGAIARAERAAAQYAQASNETRVKLLAQAGKAYAEDPSRLNENVLATYAGLHNMTFNDFLQHYYMRNILSGETEEGDPNKITPSTLR